MPKLQSELWLVGWMKETKWEFQGIFDSLESAIGACRSPHYFVAPVKLNQRMEHETKTISCVICSIVLLGHKVKGESDV